MKKLFVLVAVLFAVAALLAACGTVEDSSRAQLQEEISQQALGVKAITKNQPVPDYGGWSWERELVRNMYVARNDAISTYSYWFTFDGKVVKICDSLGFPIPYSTQLTSPESVYSSSYGNVAIPNPEINGLYPPTDAAATWISCVNDDGSVSPVYWELPVQTFLYPIKYDVELERQGKSSFSVPSKK